MKKILIIGAGRSALSLIRYLGKETAARHWQLTVADASLETSKRATQSLAGTKAIAFDIFDENRRNQLVSEADVVISMLPANFHIHVAQACLAYQKHLLTASYVSDAVQALDQEAKGKNLTFLFECGLDPGIDHMSAMRMIHKIQAQQGKINNFKSFCGGLMAPQSEGDNPWRYKFTWNPRNVVLAGQGVSQYLENDTTKYIPYWQLFRNTSPITIPDYGDFESYPNRNSLAYQQVYGLKDVSTLMRGTLRRTGYCAAWHVLVRLGVTDDTYQIDVSGKTYADFLASFLPAGAGTLANQLINYTGADTTALEKIQWLGLLEETPIELKKATPAQVLQKLLEAKWQTKSDDHDLIVMQHQFGYTLNGEYTEHYISLAVEGEASGETAMAKTVGLPLAMAAKLLSRGKISRKGVIIPIYPEIYEPILAELDQMGIRFIEHFS